MTLQGHRDVILTSIYKIEHGCDNLCRYDDLGLLTFSLFFESALGYDVFKRLTFSVIIF